ncbi:MAG: hypothetical protein JEY94_02880 [Melioribacteraceae bacterium]|nr:hypothetical protein [Melioribacteraceae bacterium]
MKKALWLLIFTSSFCFAQTLQNLLPAQSELKLFLKSVDNTTMEIEEKNFPKYASLSNISNHLFSSPQTQTDKCESILLRLNKKSQIKLDFNLASFAQDKNEKSEGKLSNNIYYFAGAVATAIITYVIWSDKENSIPTKKTFGTPKTP